MANHIMFHQGKGKVFTLPDCGGGPQFTAPTSKRIAAEYHRGFYTLTNVLNPVWDNNYYGRENWQQKFLQDVAVGDTIWCLYVPPKHNVYDVAGYAEKTFADGSSLESIGGAEFELVSGTVEVQTVRMASEVNQDVAVTEVKTHGTLAFPEGTNPAEVFAQAKIEKVTVPGKGMVVGLKVNKMPKGKLNLADIRAKIAVVAHVMSYDAQNHQ